MYPRRAGQRAVGRIGVKNVPRGVGHHDAFLGMLEHLIEHRNGRLAAGQPQNSGCQGEKGEHPDHAKNGQQKHHVGAADQHQTRGSGDQTGGNQQNQGNAAPAFVALSHGRAQALHCHDGPRVRRRRASDGRWRPVSPVTRPTQAPARILSRDSL
jgi:hypothetical protein